MRLPFLRPRKPVPERPGAPGDAVADIEAARTHARRRLVGALVLLAAGVIGFPLLFETAPRPLPGDVPIELSRRDGGAVVSATEPAPTPVARPVAPPPPEEPPASAPAPAAVAEAPPAAPPTTAVVPAPAPTPAPALAPAPAPAPAPARSDDGERARALLQGQGAAPAAPAAAAASEAAGRFVVQVGAFSDPNVLRETRARVERLGLKTYTQVIAANGGSRTRVRVGPFTTREQADDAAARIKAAGLPASILAL
jgi:DedD protein